MLSIIKYLFESSPRPGGPSSDSENYYQTNDGSEISAYRAKMDRDGNPGHFKDGKFVKFDNTRMYRPILTRYMNEQKLKSLESSKEIGKYFNDQRKGLKALPVGGRRRPGP